MRLSSHRRLTFVGAAIVALCFVLLNGAFQVVGSIPDIETCAFLSAPLAALVLLYPLCAGAVASRLLRHGIPLDDGKHGAREVRLAGAHIGGLGAAAYLGGSLVLSLSSAHTGSFPPALWPLLALLIALAAGGGWFGARGPAESARTAAPSQGG